MFFFSFFSQMPKILRIRFPFSNLEILIRCSWHCFLADSNELFEKPRNNRGGTGGFDWCDLFCNRIIEQSKQQNSWWNCTNISNSNKMAVFVHVDATFFKSSFPCWTLQFSCDKCRNWHSSPTSNQNTFIMYKSARTNNDNNNMLG